MLAADPIIQILQREKGYLADEFGVSKVGLFGSFAKEQANEASDVDLVIELDQPLGFRFLDLVDHLERTLGRRVDVLTPAGVESIRNQRVAQGIRESIVYV